MERREIGEEQAFPKKIHFSQYIVCVCVFMCLNIYRYIYIYISKGLKSPHFNLIRFPSIRRRNRTALRTFVYGTSTGFYGAWELQAVNKHSLSPTVVSVCVYIISIYSLYMGPVTKLHYGMPPANIATRVTVIARVTKTDCTVYWTQMNPEQWHRATFPSHLNNWHLMPECFFGNYWPSKKRGQ